MAILFFYLLLCLQKDVDSTCEHCPSDKPYCSEVGCIFDCPEPFYINGSNCVSHCGDWFVDENRNCVECCPNNTFYEEKLKEIQSVQYLERTCVRCNGYNQFIFNGSCVKVCPADSRYIDSISCVNECPADRPFRINVTLFDLLHYKCVEKCPHLVDGNFCIDACPNDKFVFNSLCIEQCPETEPLISSKYNGYSGYFNYCVNACENGHYRLNGHCVYNCPSLTVVFNDSCHEQCPVDAPFSCKVPKGLACGEKYTQYFMHKMCVNDCPSTMFIWNQTCVFSCPSGIPVSGNKCVDKCPLDYPLQRNITTIKDCEYQRCREVKVLLTCVKDCPTDNYIYNNSTCLTYCPSPLLHRDNQCESKCSVTKPFILDSKFTKSIWSYDDSNWWYIQKYRQIKQDVAIQTCTSLCGDDMVIWNSKCVKSCPENYHFIHNGTCTQQKCGKQYSENTPFGTVCLDTCKNHQFVYNKTCVETCPDTYKQFNGTCVDQCPESHMYTGIAVGETGIRCFDECPEDIFVFNDSCVPQCPDDLFVLVKNCITDCPPTHGLVNDAVLIKNKYNCTPNYLANHVCAKHVINFKECQKRCPEKKFLYNNTCLEFCSKDTYIFNDTCVTTCPLSYPYIQPTVTATTTWKRFYNRWTIQYEDGWYLTNIYHNVKKCIGQCQKNYPLRYEYNCLNKCPETAQFVVNTTCVKRCPEDKFLDIKTKLCVDKCANDRGLFNKTCHFNCPNKLRYIHNSRCVSKCPSSAPVALEHERFRCRKSCPDDKLFKDGKCIYHFECDDPMFAYEGLCVSSCPEGFVWYGGCSNTLGPKIAIPVLTTILLVLLACSWQSIIGFFRVSKLMFVSEEKMMEFERHQRQLQNTVDQRNKKDDEIPLSRMFNETEDDENNFLQMDTIQDGDAEPNETKL